MELIDRVNWLLRMDLEDLIERHEGVDGLLSEVEEGHRLISRRLSECRAWRQRLERERAGLRRERRAGQERRIARGALSSETSQTEAQLRGVFLTEELARTRTRIDALETRRVGLRERRGVLRRRRPGTLSKALSGRWSSRPQGPGRWRLPSKLRGSLGETEGDARPRAPLVWTHAEESATRLGELLHGRLKKETVFLTRGAEVTRSEEALARLQAHRPEWTRRRVWVARFKGMPAFTAPGRHIYLDRELVRELSDAALAFVLGHELGHHDLGHLRLFHDRLAQLPQLKNGGRLVQIYCMIERSLHNPERERDCDRHGLLMSVHAGYDVAGGVETMAYLADWARKLGAGEHVDGPEFARGAPEDRSLADRARLWAWERTQGYPSNKARADALRELASLAEPGAGWGLGDSDIA